MFKDASAVDVSITAENWEHSWM